MSLSLAAFQSGMAHALRGEDTCPLAPDSPGFRFTRSVWRSWCELRTLAAARPVFMLVPPAERRRLITAYVERGGGTAAFLPTESDALLPFLADRLPDPSHALSVCRIEMAATRARSGVAAFAPPPSHGASDRIARGPHATLVWLHADPGTIMAALEGSPLPPVGAADHPVFLAPGLPGLFRAATPEEADLWGRLPSRGEPSSLIAPLLAEGMAVIA